MFSFVKLVDYFLLKAVRQARWFPTLEQVIVSGTRQAELPEINFLAHWNCSRCLDWPSDFSVSRLTST